MFNTIMELASGLPSVDAISNGHQCSPYSGYQRRFVCSLHSGDVLLIMSGLDINNFRGTHRRIPRRQLHLIRTTYDSNIALIYKRVTSPLAVCRF